MTEVAKLDAFVQRIEKTCKNSPGRKADLRSGVGKQVEQARRMHAPVLAGPFPSGLRPSAEQAYYTVASLIAAQPGGTFAGAPDDNAVDVDGGDPEISAKERRNLGASLAYAVHHNKIRPNTAEARLHLLTRQSADGVHERLPGVVRHLLAGSPTVPVDWAYLLYDLRRWEFHRDEVAKGWLQTYYRTLRKAEYDTPTDESELR
jgi:CRISPR system Cascade subunit CasB